MTRQPVSQERLRAIRQPTNNVIKCHREILDRLLLAEPGPKVIVAEIVQNPNAWDRFIARLRATVIGWLQPA